MAKKGKTIDELMKMAKDYGVKDNPLVKTCIEQYSLQLDIIRKIKEELENADSFMTTKEYVKSRANIYVNPLVKELPHHTDSATRTLNNLADIIVKFGTEPKAKGKLADFV